MWLADWSILVRVINQAILNRRSQLGARYPGLVLLWAGEPPARNFPANAYPFRASSHFLYFAGIGIPGAVIALDAGNLTLYWDEPPADAALWHGQPPSLDAMATEIGAIAAHPKSTLLAQQWDAATIPLGDRLTHQEQSQVLGRSLGPAIQLEMSDRPLAEAIITLRLHQDEMAIAQIQSAAVVTVQAHTAGMAATLASPREANVRAAIEAVFTAAEMVPAYGSIVTVQGEVLHQERSPHPLTPGDLLLVDAGAESPGGWASDVTRTWPVSGRFTGPQRDIYDCVLAAHDACIAAIAPGVEFRDLHVLAGRVLTEGLRDLGILRGEMEGLLEQGAIAVFFPHGIGHLLGLDVHDMEDLGDLAGYAPGRSRSERPGMRYLRLDRPLQTGMTVTIEPGFYQIPQLLTQAQQRFPGNEVIDWDRLNQFLQVRGIRIEDDVHLGEDGVLILSDALPTQATAIENLVSG
jgi:Xaa-Pro aminopeptidase